MTYMDVRFLVDDLGVVYSDKEEGKENEGGEPTQEAIEEDTFNQENFEANSSSNGEEADLGGTETAEGGAVFVDVDAVLTRILGQRYGAIQRWGLLGCN